MYVRHKICQFGQFIFGKIIKTVATRSHLVKLQCTKFDFGWGSAPDSTGELTLLPHTPSWISGDLLLKEGREEKRGGHRKRGEG